MQEGRRAGVSEELLRHVSIGEFGGRYRNSVSFEVGINDEAGKKKPSSMASYASHLMHLLLYY